MSGSHTPTPSRSTAAVGPSGAPTAVETVRAVYAAFGGGEMDALMQHFHDDALHVVPGCSKVSGRHEGKRAILALYGMLFELTGGSLRVQLEQVMSDGGSRVIAVHTSRLERQGMSITQPTAVLFGFRDGKIVEVRDFFADIDANDRVFG